MDIKRILEQMENGEITKAEGNKQLEEIGPEALGEFIAKELTTAEIADLIREMGMGEQVVTKYIGDLTAAGNHAGLAELKKNLDAQILKREKELKEREKLLKQREALLPKRTKTTPATKGPLFMPGAKVSPLPKIGTPKPGINLPIRPELTGDPMEVKTVEEFLISWINEPLYWFRKLFLQKFPPYAGTDRTVVSGDWIYTIRDHDQITPFEFSTLKLLIFLLYNATKQNAATPGKLTVKFPIREYVINQGRPATTRSIAKVREQIARDLDKLYSVGIRSTAKKNRKNEKTPDHGDMRILQDKAIRNGIVYATFAEKFVGFCARFNLITMYPSKLLEIDGRNPIPFFIGLKLAEHYRMTRNHVNKTNNIIGIKTIIKELTNLLPSYEEVANTDRHFKRRLIDPIIKNLDALKDENIIEYQITGPRKKEMTPEELEETLTDYLLFEKAYIKFELINSPDQSEAVAKKALEVKEIREEKRKQNIKRQATNAIKAKQIKK